MQLTRSACFLAGFVVAIIAASGAVSANPSTPPDSLAYDSVAKGLVTIFIYNLPVNLLWFCVALYAVSRLAGDRVSRVPSDIKRYFGSIVIAIVLVTALGSMIDFALLFREGPSFSYYLYYEGWNWEVAVALIFVSIYFSSMLFVKLEPDAGLVPAGAIAMLNPVWWFIAISSDQSYGILTAASAILLLPLVLFLLWKWHKANFPLPGPR